MNHNLLFFFTIGLHACSSGTGVPEEKPAGVKGTTSPTEVVTVTSQRRPFEYVIHTGGKIRALLEAQVQFKIGGQLEKILIHNGQQVHKGDLLAVLNNAEQQLALKRAEVLLNEKKILFEDQMMSYRGDTDSTRAMIAAKSIRFSSGLANAEITYEEARVSFASTFVRAPLFGVISSLELTAHNPVNAGQLLCYIHDPSHLTVICEVLEADALKIDTRCLADVRLDSRTATTYGSRVREVDPRVDEETGMVKIRLDLQGAADLFPGMHVQATIRLPGELRILVPKEAIVMRSGKAVVFTAEDDLAKWNYVTVGRENDENVEILDGLAEEKEVIITNNLQLAHDAPVRVIERPGTSSDQ